MKDNFKQYLGDGLYTEFDGWHIVLKTERENGEHFVDLEPKVLGALNDFANKINEHYKTKHFPVPD